MTEMSVAERIKILVETLADKSAEFLKATGLTYQNLHDLTSGRSAGPSYSTTTKILSAYPQINERWFLFGEGPMLKTAASEDTGIKNSDVSDTPKKIPVNPRILTGDRRGEQPGFGYPHEGASPKQVLGNMVEQLDQNTSDIEDLRVALLEIQRQLKS